MRKVTLADVFMAIPGMSARKTGAAIGVTILGFLNLPVALTLIAVVAVLWFLWKLLRLLIIALLVLFLQLNVHYERHPNAGLFVLCLGIAVGVVKLMQGHM